MARARLHGCISTFLYVVIQDNRQLGRSTHRHRRICLLVHPPPICMLRNTPQKPMNVQWLNCNPYTPFSTRHISEHVFDLCFFYDLSRANMWPTQSLFAIFLRIKRKKMQTSIKNRLMNMKLYISWMNVLDNEMSKYTRGLIGPQYIC